MSYIVKNCPARVLFTDGYFCRQADGNILCQDCTDCVMKQIVEKCKDELGRVRTIGKDIMAEEILKLIDIQEIE